jgi:hypothetical protein
MPASTDPTRTVTTVQALVQLLRHRSDEEIRQRMYDDSLGSPWWSACKTELDTRNTERMATALVDTSRVLDKMKNSVERFDVVTDRMLQATNEVVHLLKGTRESGRRMEIAVYVMVATTVLQLFYIAFQMLR